MTGAHHDQLSQRIAGVAVRASYVVFAIVGTCLVIGWFVYFGYLLATQP